MNKFLEIDKWGESIGSIVGLTPEYGVFTVIIFFIIFILIFIASITNHENKKIIIIFLGVIALFGTLIVGGLYGYKEYLSINKNEHPSQTLEKEKLLSMEDSIKEFINNFNHGYYSKAYTFIKPSIVKRQGFSDEKDYMFHTNKYPSEFELQSINKEKYTFSVIRRFKNKTIKYQKKEKYKVENKDKYWCVIQKLYSNKIENSHIKYEGKNQEGEAVAYIPDFRKDDIINLEAYSYDLILKKDCSAKINDDKAKWYQNETGFFIKSDSEKISFDGQGIDKFIDNCILK